MGQGDVLEVLEGTKEWMTTREVQALQDSNLSNVTRNLKTLFDNGEIYRKETRSSHPNNAPVPIWRSKDD